MHIAAQTNQMIEHQIMKKSYYFYCNYIFGLNVEKTYYTCHAKFGFFEVNEKKLFIDKIKGFEQKMSGKYTQKNNCNFIIILYTYIYVYEFKPQSNNQYL